MDYNHYRVDVSPEDKEYNDAYGAYYREGIVCFHDNSDHQRHTRTDDLIVDNLGRCKFTCADTGKKFILTPVKD